MGRELRATLRNEVLLRRSAIATAISTTTTITTAPAVSAATTLAATGTAHTACVTAATATLSLSLALALPCEGVGTDIAERRFHRIRLCATRDSVASVAPIITPFLPLPPPNAGRLPKAHAGTGIATRAAAFSTAPPVAPGRRIRPVHGRLQIIRLLPGIGLRQGIGLPAIGDGRSSTGAA